MPIRLSKIALVFIVAANISIVVINNLIDYSANYTFLKNVLSMDTTFPDNTFKWRAITTPFILHALYIFIIILEIIIAYFCWAGIIRLMKFIKSQDDSFERSKTPAVIGLTLCLLLFGFVFLTLGVEWFSMWQSKIWNGEFAALRIFTMSGISLIYLNMKDYLSKVSEVLF